MIPSGAAAGHPAMASAHPADSAIFGHLWTTAEASALFSDEGRTQAWLNILAALAQAQADTGLIPADAAETIRAHADVSAAGPGAGGGADAGDRAFDHGADHGAALSAARARAGVGVLRRHGAGPVGYLVRADLPGAR